MKVYIDQNNAVPKKFQNVKHRDLVNEGLLKGQYDLKLLEYINTLLLRDPRVEVVEDASAADYVVMLARTIDNETRLEHDRYIVLNPGDVPAFMGGCKQGHTEFRQHAQGKKLIYVQTEWNMEYTQSLVRPGKHLFYISLPLLLGGSAFNIHRPDYDGDLLFVNNISKNPKDYQYEWGHVGHRSSPDRKVIEKPLKRFGKEFVFHSNFAAKKLKPIHPAKSPSGTHTAYLLATSHKGARIKDNRTTADIPHAELMELMRRTKVNLSCNGHGVWCLKDGELFSRNCFNLRQYHPELDRNPLTPKDGKHWAVFKTEQVVKQIKYYLHNPEERERINDAGHEYFKEGVSGAWAKAYTDMFIEYLREDDKKVFGGFLL